MTLPVGSGFHTGKGWDTSTFNLRKNIILQMRVGCLARKPTPLLSLWIQSAINGFAMTMALPCLNMIRYQMTGSLSKLSSRASESFLRILLRFLERRTRHVNTREALYLALNWITMRIILL